MSKRANSRVDSLIRNNLVSSTRSQVTVFIILAIVIVAVVIGYFLLRDKIFVKTFPAKFQPIENYFLDCVNEKAEEGKEIIMQRAGWIYPPDFEAGSGYSPFSSQLDFFGNAVPYWYYVSGNNLVKEQVPSKQKMQEQLAQFVEENLDCDFSDFEAQGYIIDVEKKDVKVNINDLSVDVEVSADLNIEKENEKASQSLHKTNIETKLGRFYQQAIEIYSYEKGKAFLEAYAVDVLRLYAPVDGVEISCAPKTWMADKVVSDLQQALEANIQSIKVKGNYYTNADKYFIVNDIQTDDAVNFIYDRNWPYKIEVWPAENSVLIAEPVGNQQGLGILGFCYVPYHFVYDVMFPTLIQVYDSKEVFQFPVAVVISKNEPRNALPGEAVNRELELCKYKNTDIAVYTYDTGLNAVEADINFKCLDQECDIGETVSDGEEAFLLEKFPQCVNGFIIARADGFAEKKYMISTNNEGTADIILDKLYNLSVEINLGDKEVESGIIYFSGEDYSTTVVWPEQKIVRLKQGAYNITLYVYRNSSLVFPASSQRKCVETAKPGLLGIFGATQEQCFDIQMPSQQVTSVLAGGGKTFDYFTEDRLERGSIKIIGESMPVPTSLDDLSKNYVNFEAKNLIIE